VFVLVANAVGPSTEGLEGVVVSNHAGTLLAVEPDGKVLASSAASRIEEEIVTVTLEAGKRKINHPPERNRRLPTVVAMFEQRLRERSG